MSEQLLCNGIDYAWVGDATGLDDGSALIAIANLESGRYCRLPTIETRQHRRIARKSLVRLAGAVNAERLHEAIEDDVLVQYYRHQGVRIPRSLRSAR